MKKLLLVWTLVLLGTSTLLAQRTVRGTITDANGEALFGASVLVKGTFTGTVTDIDGAYEVSMPDGASTLVFSYTGYTTQEVEVGASNVLDVVLQEGVTLEAAVVTALGIQREEKAIGYAVQKVDGDDVVGANTVSALDALSGKAAGVQITSASGAAGAASRIVLRGQTTFNGNNEALIVIDGVRVDNSENHTERSLGGVANSNRAMDINPNDIESITVLKGAAATALYGVEGARGVVLITTKKGNKGQGISVDYSTNYTISEVNKLQDLQTTYAQGVSGIYFDPEVNYGGLNFFKATSFGPRIDTMSYDGATDYPYHPNGRLVGQSDPNAKIPAESYRNDENFFQRGSMWSNNLSLSGGSDVTTYRFSFGHTTQTGIVPKNNYKRTNVGLASTTELFDNRLQASTSINYVRSGGRRIQQGSNTSGLMLGLLRTSASFDNANGLENPEDDPASYTLPDGSQRNYRGGAGYDNPYWVVNNSPFNDEVNRMYGNIRLAWDFSNWAILSTTLGTDFYSDIRKQEFEIGSNNVPAGQVLDDQWFYRQLDAYLNLTGSGSLSEDLSLSYNLGGNLFQYYQKNLYTQGDGLNFPGFRELTNTSAITTVNTIDRQKTASLFGSVDFGFKNMLYLTLTGRNDWISTLIVPNKEFNAGEIDVFYPSASLSFVFSELMESTWLSFAKLRLSVAQVGGGAPASFLTSTTFVAPSQPLLIYSLDDGWTNGILFPFKGNSGFTFLPRKGSEALVPSITTDYEAGLDLRFFNGRLGIDGTYYIRKSKDQILTIPIDNTTGFQRAVLNSGSLSTNGTEVVLNITPVRTPGFSWDIGVNFSTWKTYVDELAEGVPNQYLDGFTGTGIYNIAPDLDENGNVTNRYEYGQILGGAFQRVNASDGTYDPNLPYNPDGALVIDDSGSTDPNAADYNPNYGYPLADPIARVIGNPKPDFLMGINNTIRYKGLSLSFLFDIKQGGEMWNGTAGALTFFGMTALTEDRDPLNAEGFSDYENATHVFEGVLASDNATTNT
ncbi:MAG: SusC/RagA family TonB-linked outer membrane protein, partial [Phaeodactylibacter sp.]|nr:SusC/RagA family TonB-linked outer membrane protein [Phaeodactylibacter sp.]